MSKVIILGSGAAPGVPSLAYGFGDCDPKEEKNIRLRSGTYMEISGVKLLIDTSPDLRMQLILSNIRDVDAVFYTHAHADHLHGIDDLREINRITGRAIELFASPENLSVIRTRFPYLIVEKGEDVDPVYRAALHPNAFEYEKSFYFRELKVTPIKLQGHNVECSGYIFNDGEVVHISDFRDILGFQCITTGSEQIQRLTVHEENRFLRLVNDELCQAVKILAGMLPNEGAVVTLVLDNFGNVTHKVIISPFCDFSMCLFTNVIYLYTVRFLSL